MSITDDDLIQELTNRLAQSRKAFSDLSVVNRKLLNMNELLERSESLKSNFLSNIRNEINNPLNSIMGLAGQLSLIGAENEAITALSSMIRAEANILDFQLKNIFLAAELEAGDVNPHYARVHISTVLKTVIESFLHSAAHKNIQIHFETGVSSGSDAVIADSLLLQCIVSNLLANAIEFSRTGGIVEVGGDKVGTQGVQVTVRDFGIGIAVVDQQRIFDRFVQLDSGTTRSHPGHGLGLSVTKALVDLMGGSITLNSTPGEGTLFTVDLPSGRLAGDETSFEESGNIFIFEDMNEA